MTSASYTSTACERSGCGNIMKCNMKPCPCLACRLEHAPHTAVCAFPENDYVISTTVAPASRSKRYQKAEKNLGSRRKGDVSTYSWEKDKWSDGCSPNETKRRGGVGCVSIKITVRYIQLRELTQYPMIWSVKGEETNELMVVGTIKERSLQSLTSIPK